MIPFHNGIFKCLVSLPWTERCTTYKSQDTWNWKVFVRGQQGRWPVNCHVAYCIKSCNNHDEIYDFSANFFLYRTHTRTIIYLKKLNNVNELKILFMTDITELKYCLLPTMMHVKLAITLLYFVLHSDCLSSLLSDSIEVQFVYWNKNS